MWGGDSELSCSEKWPLTFIQLEFLYLFVLTFGVYWALPRRGQNLLLVGVSAVFYGWVHPWFLFLLYGSAVLDFCMGRCMARWPARKRLFLTISMAGNLGMLGYFKYCDFFIENVIALITALGVETSLQTLGIFLRVPSSTLPDDVLHPDIYRELSPSDFLDYLVFVSFSPVATSCERAGRLLPQMERERVFPGALQSGLSLASGAGEGCRSTLLMG